MSDGGYRLGRLADHYDRVLIYHWGLALFAACSIAIPLFPSFSVIFAIRFIQVMAGEVISTWGIALLSESPVTLVSEK